jgi:CheY-like chemotaxis protein
MHTANWLILIVEDEDDGRHVVSKLLNKANLATHCVATAEEAVALLEQHRYAGAVIDLALPGMDGLELLRHIRNNVQTADLPCIAITAYHNSGVRQQAQQAGFSGYFPKPINDRAFAQDVMSIIAQS